MMQATMTKYHEAVFAHKAVEALQVKPEGIYVDATFGGGTHSALIINQIIDGRLFSFDRDPDVKDHLPQHPSFTFIPQNFRFLKNYLAFYGVQKVDGILADLGVSSHQFDEAERGFSIREDGPLDMRMDRKSGISALELVNTYSKEQLTSIFKLNGDLREASYIAKLILKQREVAEIRTTGELIALLSPVVPPPHRNKFLSRVFQAIRMEVNHEIDDLKSLLLEGSSLLNTDARFVVISYHSGEDRLVKNFFSTGNFEGRVEQDFFGNVIRPLEPLTRKPLIPDEEEQSRNPRSRSAKMRVAVKLSMNQ
jgi:16S rRNA (cytosine1402-N4)-methyltransferase